MTICLCDLRANLQLLQFTICRGKYPKSQKTELSNLGSRSIKSMQPYPSVGILENKGHYEIDLCFITLDMCQKQEEEATTF